MCRLTHRRARVQIKKSEEDLNRGFGQGSTQVLNAAQKREAAKAARGKGRAPPPVEQLGVDDAGEGVCARAGGGGWVVGGVHPSPSHPGPTRTHPARLQHPPSAPQPRPDLA